jgi:hypothetical protein
MFLVSLWPTFFISNENLTKRVVGVILRVCNTSLSLSLSLDRTIDRTIDIENIIIYCSIKQTRYA